MNTASTSTIKVLALPIAADHPSFAGHFPGQPIVPGVVLLDLALRALMQAEGLACAQLQLPVAKFLSPVRPGEILQLRYEAKDMNKFSFSIVVLEHDEATRMVASGSLALIS